MDVAVLAADLEQKTIGAWPVATGPRGRRSREPRGRRALSAGTRRRRLFELDGEPVVAGPAVGLRLCRSFALRGHHNVEKRGWPRRPVLPSRAGWRRQGPWRAGLASFEGRREPSGGGRDDRRACFTSTTPRRRTVARQRSSRSDLRFAGHSVSPDRRRPGEKGQDLHRSARPTPSSAGCAGPCNLIGEHAPDDRHSAGGTCGAGGARMRRSSRQRRSRRLGHSAGPAIPDGDRPTAATDGRARPGRPALAGVRELRPSFDDFEARGARAFSRARQEKIEA